ncbi:hypothetical protein C6P45_003207 [Maudiozyma exigua]|uniref:Myb-like domain-containing protein n=1 Tax=Maudiozyma exigua TaxID=34358 RepID=A0A9P6VU37_MAUEX|nr:hypothetical protein C6P45_003207 [Kazachstania exigua]
MDFEESVEEAVYRYVRDSNSKRRIEQQDDTPRKIPKYNDHNEIDTEHDELRDESPSINKINTSQRVEQFHQILPNVTASSTHESVEDIRAFVPFDEIVKQMKKEVEDTITIPPKRFSEEEDKLIDKFINKYCDYEKITLQQFKKFVWPHPNINLRRHKLTDFWKLIYSIFKYRSQGALYNHIRRRYNTFKKGRFSVHEEDTIRKYIGTDSDSKTSWASLGYYLNRLPDDCKDYWKRHKKASAMIENKKKIRDVDEFEEVEMKCNIVNYLERKR